MITADPPIKDIHTFIGNITVGTSVDHPDLSTVVPLSADNVLWANTVLAAGSAVGMVVYTGKETRASMNTSEPESKVGLLDIEINRMAKVSTRTRCLRIRSEPLISLIGIIIGLVHRHISTFSPFGSFKRFQKPMVHLRIQILDPFLDNHSYQVGRQESQSARVSLC